MKIKSFFSGMVTGIVLTSLLLFAFAKADEFGLEFNQFRINVNGVDKIQWGSNFKMENGMEIPSSICYNDTNYISLRAISSLFNKEVYYNDYSRTIYALDGYNSVTGGGSLVKREDLNGVLWDYGVKRIDDNYYLEVSDKDKMNVRCYRIPNKDCVKVTDDSIYFLKCLSVGEQHKEADVALQRIDFLNDANSQDGVQIGEKVLTNIYNAAILFDENYIAGIYYVYFSTQAHGELSVYDITRNKLASAYLSKTWARDLRIENKGDTLVLNYKDQNAPQEYRNRSLVFDKASMTFRANNDILNSYLYDYNEKKYVDIEVKND